MATWTLHDGRWYLIGAPEFVAAWEGHDGRYHWSVGTRTAGGGGLRTGFLYEGGLEAAKARAIEVMTIREKAKALHRIIGFSDSA